MTKNWNEADHPRDENGKFIYKRGGILISSNQEKMQDRADTLYTTMKESNENKNILLKGSISFNKSDQNFRDSLITLFGHEGGYTNDPNDYGGVTNMGITQTTYNNYCKKHNIDIKNVKYLTKNEAMNVYYEDYWKASGADKVENPAEALILFDTAVLHGVGRAKQFYKASNGDFNKLITKILKLIL